MGAFDKLVPVTRAVLREIITKHIATKRRAEPAWVREFSALVPDEKTLRGLI